MHQTIEELEKEYPKSVDKLRKQGFPDYLILNMYQVEYMEKAYFQGRVHQITITDIPKEKK